MASVASGTSPRDLGLHPAKMGWPFGGELIALVRLRLRRGGGGPPKALEGGRARWL